MHIIHRHTILFHMKVVVCTQTQARVCSVRTYVHTLHTRTHNLHISQNCDLLRQMETSKKENNLEPSSQKRWF